MTEPQSPAGTHPTKPFHQNYPLQVGALLVWVVAWIGVQSLLDRNAFDAGQQIGSFLVIILGIFMGAFLRGRAWFFRLLTSVPFAISQISFLAIALLAAALTGGTEPLNLQESLWFWALLSLLAVSMLCVAWKRRPYPAHRVGFLLVHVSASLVLLGGLWGQFSEVRGSRTLRVGETVDSFSRLKKGKLDQDAYALPGFRLRLEQVAVEPSGPAYRLYAFTHPDGKGGFEKEPKTIDAPPGGQPRLPGSGLLLEVERILPNGVDAGEFINNPKAPENPALRVMLGIGTQEPLVGDLFSRVEGKARRDEPGGRFAVVFQDHWSTELLTRLRPGLPTSQKLLLTYLGRTFEHEAKVGGSWDFPTFRLTVEKAYPDFAVKKDRDGNPEAYSRSQNPVEPWLELRLHNPDGSTKRVMLSASHPDVSDQLNEPNLPKGLNLRFVQEGAESQSRFVVFTREDQSARLVEKGRVSRSEPFSLGKPFVVERGLSVTPVATLDHAEYVPNFVPYPDPTLAGTFARPVMKVKVWDPASSRSEEKWLDAKGPDGTPVAELFMNGQVKLIYQPRSPEAEDLRTVLTVLDEQGHPLLEKTTKLRDPLVFRGHAFFPDGTLPEQPGVSKILIEKKSGFWLSALGYLSLLIGIAWMFYLKPVLKRRAVRAEEPS